MTRGQRRGVFPWIGRWGILVAGIGGLAFGIVRVWAPGLRVEEMRSASLLLLVSIAACLASIFETPRDRIVVWLLFLIGAHMVLRSAIYYWGVSQQPSTAAKLSSGERVGDLAPDLVAKDLDGRTWRLADLRGKVVLVFPWPQRFHWHLSGIPYLAYAQRFLSEEGLVVLGVSHESSEAQARVRDEYGISFPLLIDGVGIPSAYTPRSPLPVLVGRDGRIRRIGVISGEWGLQILAREVRGLSADPPIESVLPQVYSSCGGQ